MKKLIRLFSLLLMLTLLPLPVLALPETEPNDSFESAATLLLKNAYTGSISTPTDVDYYAYTLDGVRKLQFDLSCKTYELGLRVWVTKAGQSSPVKCYERKPSSASKLKKTKKISTSLILPAGKVYAEVFAGAGSPAKTSGYSLYAKSLGNSASKLITDASSVTLVIGLEKKKPVVTINPSYFDMPTLTWQSDHPEIASFDPSTGEITPMAPGSAKITVSGGGMTATIAVKAVANEYFQSKPTTGKSKKLYISTRKLYYSGNDLMAEIYVLNRTGKTLRGTMEDELNVALMSYVNSRSGEVIHLYSFGGWLPVGGALKNGKYAVIKLRLSAATGTTNLNLYSKKYLVTLYNPNMYYTKAARGKDGYEHGLFLDAKALPEPGMQSLTATVR